MAESEQEQEEDEEEEELVEGEAAGWRASSTVGVPNCQKAAYPAVVTCGIVEAAAGCVCEPDVVHRTKRRRL